jgi:hypothetical protein
MAWASLLQGQEQCVVVWMAKVTNNENYIELRIRLCCALQISKFMKALKKAIDKRSRVNY